MLLVMLFYNFVRRFELPYISMLIELITGPEKAVFWTGIIGAVSCIGAVLSGVIIGYLADRLKPQTIIVPSLFISTVLLIMNAVSQDLITLSVTRTLLFFFAGSLFPILQKLLAAATPVRKRGKVFGWGATFNNVGGMVSTMFSGWVIFLFGTRGVFFAAAVLTFILIPVTVWGIKVITSQPFYIAHAGKAKNQ
jgi:DHA1 family multidrug resistance protein-like MFS transporter